MLIIELKNRSEYTNEFILDYNKFLNNYTIYSFPMSIEILEMINLINILILLHKGLMMTIVKSYSNLETNE